MSESRATCQVSIRGSFDVHWVDYLGEMLLYADVTDGRVRTTTLFGRPRDLAAFIGMLSMLADLGFHVIACEYQRADPLQETVDGSGSAAVAGADTVRVG
jgi:hypothetical protein